MSLRPPSLTTTLMEVEWASMLFSTSSLTADTGRWITSPAAIRGVKKNRETGTRTGKSETGNRETGVPVPVPVWKNQKPGTPVPVPGFWYPVFTGLPGTGFYIYIFSLGFTFYKYINIYISLHFFLVKYIYIYMSDSFFLSRLYIYIYIFN
jgi:hypothetical protein